MRKAPAILLALACSAQAQTFITVTADTNRVIRTNFSLVRSQVSDLSGATFAISNITGLQTALDGKLATNGDAIALTNFPSLLLRTNGSALELTNFPLDLLRTNGSAAALTNFPTLNQNTTGTASNVTGVVAIANGGTGSTNASEARTALELGSAATNDATAFQPASTNLTALASGDGSSLTNVTVTDAGTLTNFPAELLRTNGDAAGLTNFPADLLRTNGDAASLTNFPSNLLRTNGDGSGLSNVSVDLTTVLPVYSNNAAKVLAVTTNESGVEWIAVSNTVTDAASLTNFPAYLLQTNGDASGLTNFPAELLRTNGNAGALTNFPAELLRTNGDGSGLTNLPFVGGASATNVGPIMASMNSLSSDTGTGGSITNIANGIWVIASVTNNSFAVARALMTPGLFVGSSTPLNFTNNFSFGMHLSSASTNFAQGNQRYYVGTEINYSTNDPTNVVLGWRVKDQTIYAAMHNGTSYSEPFSTNNVFETNGASYVWTWVEGDGTGSVSWYVNGELLGTATNGPTNRAYGRYLSVSAHNDTGSNTTSPTTARIVNFIYNFK